MFKNNKPIRVYIAGPISHGNRLLNCLRAMEVADEIMALGLHPFLPHLDFWWNEISPKDYETWMYWDFSWLEVCDAVLRIPGTSNGANREEQFAKDHNIPIYYSVEELKNAIRQE